MAQPRRDPTQWGVRPGSLRLPYEEEHDGRFDRPPSKTDYVRNLEVDVEGKIASGELPCGPGDESGRAIDISRKDAKMAPSIAEEVTVADSAVVEKPRTRAKKLLRKKVARASKKHGGKGAIKEQTCVNIPVPSKKLLDAKCKKIGRTRNRVINELIAKFVGWKGLKKIA